MRVATGAERIAHVSATPIEYLPGCAGAPPACNGAGGAPAHPGRPPAWNGPGDL